MSIWKQRLDKENINIYSQSALVIMIMENRNDSQKHIFMQANNLQKVN